MKQNHLAGLFALMVVLSLAGGRACAQGLDQYGGYTGLSGDNTSGFFRTQKINGRYWLITPDNNVFWGVGPTTVQYNCTWCQRPRGMTYNTFNLNFLRNNPTGQPGWLTSLHNRLEAWGQNCEGGFSQDISGTGGKKIPETMRVYFLSSAHSSRGGNMVAGGRFPDVFDEPTWTEALNSLASQVAAYKNDPWRIGHFVENEVSWSYSGKTLPVAFFEQDASKPGKQYMVDTFMYNRYGGDIATLNSAWGASYTSWSGSESTSMINSTELPPDDSAWPARKTDKVAFLREVADKYYSSATTMIRANDPNHLVFSERIGLFGGSFETPWDDYNKQVWEKAGEYCDVIAINSYHDHAALEQAYGYYGKVFQHARKPIMITEWNRCGNDTIVSYTQWSWPNQSIRAERAVEAMQQAWSLSVPNDPNDGLPAYYMMGKHWFQLYDMPPLGRADGEDYNPGMINNMDEPYVILTDAKADVGQQLYDILANGAPLVQLDRPVVLSPKAGHVADAPSVVFEWESVSGAASYDVLISQSMSFPEDQCIIARDLTSTSYSPGPVLSSGVWFWCVRARDAQGRGGLYSELERFSVDARNTVDIAASFGFETMAGWRSHGRGDSGGWGEVFARGDGSVASAGERSMRLEFTGFSKNRFVEQANLGAIETSKYPAGDAPSPPEPGEDTGPYTGHPLVFEDDFNDGNADGWLLPSGSWSVSSNQYRQTDTSSWQLRTNAPGRFGNAEYGVDLRIVSAPDPGFWAGIMINRAHISHGQSDSGYLIGLRRNGNLFIWNHVHTLIHEVEGVVADTSVYNRLHVVADGATLTLYVNDAQVYTWTDPDTRYAGGGFFCLMTGRASAVFDNVAVHGDSFDYFSFEGQDLVFRWGGGELDYSQSDTFEFDVYPHRMLMQNAVVVPSTKYVRVRMIDDVGGTAIDEKIDPDGQLPIGAWSRVAIAMGTTARANVSSLEFIVNNGDYRFPLEHRVRLHIDNMTPPASVGPAESVIHQAKLDTFDRLRPETWHATSGEWGIVDGTLYGFGVRMIPALFLASGGEFDQGILSARVNVTSSHAAWYAPSGTAERTAWLVFGADEAAGTFYYAGLDESADQWRIGRYNGSNPTVLASASESIEADSWYDLVLRRSGGDVQLEVNGQRKVSYSSLSIPSGGFGLGMVYSHMGAECFVADHAPEVEQMDISDDLLLANDNALYSVTLTASDIHGAGEIRDMRAVLYNGQAWSGANGRGYLIWGQTDDDITQITGTWTLMGDASGGGRWGYRSDDWGSDTYITPVSASTTISGNERVVEFIFTVKVAWADAYDQSLRGFARDVSNAGTGWIPFSVFYDVRRIPGDFDLDGDVDQSDFGHFQGCLSGPGVTQHEPACLGARLDSDEDVDQDDFAILQGCMGGANVPADLNCAD